MSINNPILVLSALIWEQWSFICRLSAPLSARVWWWVQVAAEWEKRNFLFRVIEATAQPQTQAWRLWLQSVIRQSRSCRWPHHLSGPKLYMQPHVYTSPAAIFTIIAMTVYWVHPVKKNNILSFHSKLQTK